MWKFIVAVLVTGFLLNLTGWAGNRAGMDREDVARKFSRCNCLARWCADGLSWNDRRRLFARRRFNRY